MARRRKVRIKPSNLIVPDQLIDAKYSNQTIDQIRNDIEKCKNGIEGLKYFINTYIYVPNKIKPEILEEKPTWFQHINFEKEKINLKLYPKQEEYLEQLFNNRLVATYKSRQCLPLGSKVYTPMGLVEIQYLKQGDAVYSYNEDSSEVEIDIVVDAQKSGMRNCESVLYSNGQNTEQGQNHPFLLSNNVQKKSIELEYGDNLRNFDEHGVYLDDVEVIDAVPTGEKECQDIETFKNKNFIFEGFVVHNTGISTITQAFILQYSLFNENKEIVIVSKTEADAIKFLASIYYMYNHLPFFLRRQYSKAVKKSFHIGSPNTSTKITVLTSTSKSGRSLSATILVLDECVSGDTRVTCKVNGEISVISIRQLYELYKYSCSEIQVYAFDGTSFGFYDLIEVKSTGMKDVFELASIGGVSLSCTNNHPIMDFDGSYKRSDAVEYLPVVINNQYFEDPLTVDEDFFNGKTFGFIYGGQMGETNNFEVSGQYDDLIRFIRLQHRFGFIDDEYIKNIEENNTHQECGDNKTISTHLPYKLMLRMKQLGMPSGKKVQNDFTLPGWISSSYSASCGFWNGIFSAQGRVKLSQSSNNNNVGEIETICFYKTDDGVRYLTSLLDSLKIIGIKQPKVYIRRVKNAINGKMLWEFKILLRDELDIQTFLTAVGKLDLNQDKECKRLILLSIYKIKSIINDNLYHYKQQRQLSMFGMDIRISQDDKISFNIMEFSLKCMSLWKHGIVFIPIFDREYRGEQETFNMNVAGCHTYVADDIVTHNCEFIEHADDLWSAAQPTLSATGGQAILISTPWMYKSWFWGICHGEGGDAFKTFNIKWNDIPGRDKEWYQAQCAELGHDRLKIMTELDMQWIIPFNRYYSEEFLNNDFSIKKKDIVQWQLSQGITPLPPKFKELEREQGLSILIPPEEGREYYFGVDPYEGGKDNNAGLIIGDDMRVNAYFKTQRLDIFELVKFLCDFYGTKVCIERNRGFYLIKEFENRGLHTKYVLFKLVKRKNVFNEEFGYLINGENRKRLISSTSEFLKYVHSTHTTDNTMKIMLPEELMEEMQYFVIKKSKIEGLEHDDLIFALIGALYVRDNKATFYNWSQPRSKSNIVDRVNVLYDSANANDSNAFFRNGKLNTLLARNFLAGVRGEKILTVDQLNMLDQVLNVGKERIEMAKKQEK